MDPHTNKRYKGPDGSPRTPDTSTRSARIQRPSPSPSASKPSIRLTVKAPPSKLRQALGSDDIPPNPYIGGHSNDTETPEPPVRSARSTRNPRAVLDPDSEDDAEEVEEDEEEDEDEDAEGEVDAELLAAEDSDREGQELSDEDEDEDADADADADADGDLDMSAVHPPPPIVKTSVKSTAGNKKRKLDVTVSAPPTSSALKSVEDKEMDDDEELSDLQSDEDLGRELDDDEDEGSDDELGGSRSATPDLSKLTKRQRAAYDEGNMDGHLLALSNEAQKKKHLTVEEHATRRAEMARRRKNLSEKKNEEEKMDTINKLLKKPAPKRRTRAEIMAAAAAAEHGEDGDYDSANPLYVRWVNDAQGSRIGVPMDWLEAPIGEQLAKGWVRPPPRKLIEEVA